MNVSVEGAFVYFTIPIFGGIPITQTTVSSCLVTALLIFACIKIGKNLQKRPGPVQVLAEKGVSMIYDLTVSAMGAHNAHFPQQYLRFFHRSDRFPAVCHRGSELYPCLGSYGFRHHLVQQH